jgi:succinoglycan biosynthesis protein ExoM
MLAGKHPHVAVCIPTFKRPLLLDKCLSALQHQKCNGFVFSIVVIDNDVAQSAREIVTSWQNRSPVRLFYEVEVKQNISLARNRAIENCQGEFIAFIDDDEFPEPTWLHNLMDALRKFSADGVLGPVVPYYEGQPPEWLVKSNVCIRSSFKSGTVLNNPKYMRSGNFIISRSILDGIHVPFAPRLGRTGGEDADFFERMLRAGKLFVWCNEASVFELVSTERQRIGYHVQRAFIRGVTSADQEALLSWKTIKSIVAACCYSASLPVLMLTARHLFMKYLIKDCDHIAKLFAHLGIKLARGRTF